MVSPRPLLLLLLLPLMLAAQSSQQCQVELFLGDPDFSTGDGGPALNAKFAALGAIAAADDGTIYVADYLSYRIRKIDPQGIITTIAGTGIRGTAGDGGPAIQAQLSAPGGLSLSPDGALYFVDAFNRIRRIAQNGTIETAYSVSNGSIGGMFAAAGGVLYFTETAAASSPSSDARIGLYRLESNGSKTTIAGGLPPALFGPPIDAVPALEFRFSHAGAVSVDFDGRVLVVDLRRVMRVDNDGIIRAIVGNGGSSFVDGAPALETGLNLAPSFIVPTVTGDLFLGGTLSGLNVVRDGTIHRVLSGRIGSAKASAAGLFLTKDDRAFRLLADDTLEPVAGVDRAAWYEPGRPLSHSLLRTARKMLTDSQGRLYYFEADFATVVTRTTLDGRTEIVAGGGDQPADDGVPVLGANLRSIGDIALDGEDRLYLSVGANGGRPSMILRVEFNGTLTVLAGEGEKTQPERFANENVLDANFLGVVPFIAVSPSGALVFQIRSRGFLVDDDGIMRNAPPGTTSFTAFDRQGRFLAEDAGFLSVYDDLGGPAFNPFSLRASQGASAGNGTFFALAVGQRIIRRTPDGRTTDLFNHGAGLEFTQGKLAPNAGLGVPLGIATNSDGDLFIADPTLHRMFVMRDADTCAMERPYSADVLNGASFTTNLGTKGFAPGELVSVFGDFLGGAELAYGAPGQSNQGTWQTSVGGLEVFVDDQPAPIIFSRADQAAFVIPNEVQGTMNVRFRRNGLDSPTFTYAVKNASPGVFTVNSSGGGQAAALNQDSSINSPSNRAAPGSVIVLYVTGAGLTNPPSQTGSLNGFPLPQLTEQVEVQINWAPAVVEFAGPAPGLISGVVQINARIPAETPSGTDIPVFVKIGGVDLRQSPSGQWPTISIQ